MHGFQRVQSAYHFIDYPSFSISITARVSQVDNGICQAITPIFARTQCKSAVQNKCTVEIDSITSDLLFSKGV